VAGKMISQVQLKKVKGLPDAAATVAKAEA